MTTDWPTPPTPTEPRSPKGAATQRRIMLAAARLFAERGIDRVTPSEILEASGQRNASAIQYHFGSMGGLVVATVQPRADIRDPIDAARTRILKDLTADGQTPSLGVAVRAWVLPVAGTLETAEGRDFLRIAAQLIRQLPLEHRVTPNQPSDARVRQMVLGQLGYLSPPVAAERVGVASTLIAELYANRAREIADGLTPNLSISAFNEEVVSMITGMLAAPAGSTR